MGGLEDTQLGSYHFLKRIGSGGMGEVYLAEQAKLARQVAIKVLRGAPDNFSAAQTADAEAQFTREARAIAALDHPYILPLYDFGEQQGMTFLVMPYMPAGSLASSIVAGPEQRLPLPWPPPLASALIHQVAQALQFAHDSGIIHRDVKPDNILIRQLPGSPLPHLHAAADQPDSASSSVQVVLADFGIARFLSEPAGTTGATGTPHYSAPEQLAGHPVPASDQYALACLAYLLLTGHYVFSGTVDELHYQHQHSQPLPPSQANPALSSQVDQVLLRALAKEPTQRFAQVTDFSLALQQTSQSHYVARDYAPYAPIAALLPAIVDGASALPPIPTSLPTGPRAPAPPPLLTPTTDGRATQPPGTVPDHAADGQPMPLPGPLASAPFSTFLRRKNLRPTSEAHRQPLSAAEVAHTAVRSTISLGEVVTEPDRQHDGIVAHLPVKLSGWRTDSTTFRVLLVAVAALVIVVAVLGLHALIPGAKTNLLSQVGGTAPTTSANATATGTPLNAATATAVAQHGGATPGTTPGTSPGPQTTPTSTPIPTATSLPTGGHYEGNRNSTGWVGWEDVNWYEYLFVRASWVIPSIPVRNSSEVNTWVGFNGDSNELGSSAGYFARAGVDVSVDAVGHVDYDAYWQVQNTSGGILAQSHNFYPVQPGQQVSFNVWYDGTNLHFDFYDASTGWGNGGTEHTFAAAGWREYTADWIISNSDPYLAHWNNSALTLTDCTASLNNSTWYPINTNAYYSDTLVTSGGTIMAYPGSLAGGATQFSPTFAFGG